MELSTRGLQITRLFWQTKRLIFSRRARYANIRQHMARNGTFAVVEAIVCKLLPRIRLSGEKLTNVDECWHIPGIALRDEKSNVVFAETGG